MDGSVVGCGCVALMIHVLYKGRALPLAWREYDEAPRGISPRPCTWPTWNWSARRPFPEGTSVVFLGDGEFDGTTLQQTLNEAGWRYACRTAQSTVVQREGQNLSPGCFGRV